MLLLPVRVVRGSCGNFCGLALSIPERNLVYRDYLERRSMALYCRRGAGTALASAGVDYQGEQITRSCPSMPVSYN